MALKAILDSIDSINESLRGEYKKGEDGKFYLDVTEIESHPSVGALSRAKSHEKEARIAESKRATELQAALDKLTDERDGLLRGAIPKADVDKLETSYKDRLTKRETELQAEINKMHSSLTNILVDNVATSLATQISKSPDLLIPHIRGRLSVDVVDGKHVTRVLDKDGKLSAATLEEFRGEIVANPVFAPIIIASKGSGGSTIKELQNSGSATTKKTLAEMKPEELAAHINAKQSQN